MGNGDKLTILALTNGMIGGSILVLPLIALNTNYTITVIVCMLMGVISFFSCLLCIRHLNNCKDLDSAILSHFDNNIKYKQFYDGIIVVSMCVLLILYFDLICDQWVGIFEQSLLIPFLNAMVLLPLVYVMKKWELGATLLGYGILSIVGYCIFLLWMISSAPSNLTHKAPNGSNFIQLAAALTSGYSIQSIFIPILRKNQESKNDKKVLIITYLIGFLVYLYISCGGAYSILNRQPNTPKPQTIQQYFEQKQWEVMVIELLYLLHLFSAFPQFLLISKKRFFSMNGWEQSNKITNKQMYYVVGIVLICLAVRLTRITVEVIIQINGSVISFCFIYLIPIGLHIKCVYFSKQPKHHKFINEIKSQKDNKQTNHNQQNIELQANKVVDEKSPPIQQTENNFKPSSANQSSQCNFQYHSRYQQISQVSIMIIMVIWGLIVIGYTFINILKG